MAAHRLDHATDLTPANSNFTDVTDKRAVSAFQPTLWYDPQRINDNNRKVYLFVHNAEYHKYKEELAKAKTRTRIVLVGWDFPRAKKLKGDELATFGPGGFGFTRYAAIEFCKYIFNELQRPNNALAAIKQKAWLVDDNVSYISGMPAMNVYKNNGLNAMEDFMEANSANVFAIGFKKGATSKEASGAIANSIVNKAIPANLPNNEAAGLIQQASLWNIYRMQQNNMNFSPYFINSAEDLSLSNHLKNEGKSRLIKETAIYKLETKEDKGKNKLDLIKGLLNQKVRIMEENYPLKAGGKDYTLGDYMSLVQKGANKKEDIALTQSRAVEQLMAFAIAKKRKWVPSQVFKPMLNKKQPILQRKPSVIKHL